MTISTNEKLHVKRHVLRTVPPPRHSLAQLYSYTALYTIQLYELQRYTVYMLDIIPLLFLDRLTRM